MRNITVRDLVQFHINHFGIEPTNYSWDGESETVASSNGDIPQGLTYDDDNCYYSDGTIRHLTDDQVEFLRNSELKQLERERLWNEKASQFEKLTVEPSKSVEEIQPYLPLSASRVGDEVLFGSDIVEYIWTLESKMDSQFADTCKRLKVKDYYPIVPVRNGE